MELDRVLGGENRIAYLRCKVWSIENQEVRLDVGSDDGIKIWLNSEVVHSNNVPRGCTPDQDKVEVKLRKGWNTLMLKITQGGGEWAACARFRTPDGAPLKGLDVMIEE